MNTNNNPYNNRQVGNDKSQMTNVLHGSTPPQIPLMPPPPPNPRSRRARNWRERLLSGNNARPLTEQQERMIPQWLTGRAMAFFFVAMAACWVAFGHVPEFDLWLTASISVVLFFYGGFSMAKSSSRIKEKAFLKKVFVAGLLVRLIWVLYCYFIFNPEHYGTTYGDSADVTWYMPFGEAVAQWIRNGFDVSFGQLQTEWHSAIDDVGYPIWLGIVNFLTGSVSDVLIPFIVKAIIGAYCALCIYRVAKRHFGEGTARMAALFVCLSPNMIYWCGTMMKEAEMVFVVCLAVDNLDRVLSSGQKYTIRALLPGMLAALALMFFRTVLGLVMFLAVFAHVVMASQRVMSLGKKIIAGLLVALTLFISMGDRIRTQSHRLVEVAQSDAQQHNIEWRSKSNSLAQYASAAVFAPLIFTIPFPSFNQANEYQLTQMQLGGGSYIKNILSFFVIWVMFMMLISGEWRQHVFVLAYTVGYHVVLVMSSFAQSGRFHMPIWPMLMLFAAYGIQMAKTNPRLRKWWPMVLAAEVVICLAWNWFKLKGRGMI